VAPTPTPTPAGNPSPAGSSISGTTPAGFPSPAADTSGLAGNPSPASPKPAPTPNTPAASPKPASTPTPNPLTNLRNTFTPRTLKLALNAAAAVVIIAIVIVLYAAVTNTQLLPSAPTNKVLAPHTELRTVVSDLGTIDVHVGTVAWEDTLHLSDHASAITIANKAPFEPITNNFMAEGATTNDDDDLLYDERAIARVIQFNSNWVDFSNNNARQEVFANVNGEQPTNKATAKSDNSQVAFHNLNIGEVLTADNAYFVITHETYTLAKDGVLTPVEGIFVYRLERQGDELLITDFESV
jgi:hypothetical protein